MDVVLYYDFYQLTLLFVITSYSIHYTKLYDILSLKDKKDLDEESSEYKKLKELQIKYKVQDIYDYETFLKRVDVIPPSLAIAQAAVESAWGKSRFIKIANNIFGHWTYNPEIGIVPLDRIEGKQHLIRVFKTLQDSISAYMLNLSYNFV